jgi:hypothetical protein
MTEKRTYADRREYIKAAVIKRRRKLKTQAVELMGGRCILCGYDHHQGVLDFHHVDAASKQFGIGQDGSTRSWERIEAELRKCILVCANCHREIELGLHDKTKTAALFIKQWSLD